jgi:hypothetical protein
MLIYVNFCCIILLWKSEAKGGQWSLASAVKKPQQRRSTTAHIQSARLADVGLLKTQNERGKSWTTEIRRETL